MLEKRAAYSPLAGGRNLMSFANVAKMMTALHAAPELNITERRAGDVIILDLKGRITIGEGSVTLREAIRRMVAEGERKVLLNLAQVRVIDSSGLAELVSGFTLLKRAGGQVKLLNVTQNLQDLLAITKLSTVFDTYDDDLKALNDYA